MMLAPMILQNGSTTIRTGQVVVLFGPSSPTTTRTNWPFITIPSITNLNMKMQWWVTLEVTQQTSVASQIHWQNSNKAYSEYWGSPPGGTMLISNTFSIGIVNSNEVVTFTIDSGTVKFVRVEGDMP